jgi:hypothetical protein
MNAVELFCWAAIASLEMVLRAYPTLPHLSTGKYFIVCKLPQPDYLELRVRHFEENG